MCGFIVESVSIKNTVLQDADFVCWGHWLYIARLLALIVITSGYKCMIAESMNKLFIH